MPMAAPSALSLIKLALLSATAVWSPISAGPTFEQHYTNSFVASASVEFKDEVFRTGSEARFALVTGEKAINPNVTCESSWAKAHTLIGDERTETGKRKQHFIPRPVDYVVFERFKKCVWRATGVTRLFSAVRIDAGDGFVRIQFGVEPKRGDKLIAGFVLNIPLSKDYRVDDDGSLAPSGGGQSTGVESRLAPELGEDASEEPSACDKDEEGVFVTLIMPMAAPSALSLIKLALLSATAVWSPISAGPTFEQHYTNSFVASASVEFKDEVFRTGSEARFALVTGEKAINPNVTCESSWAKAHTLIGDERTETGKRKQHFIPRPVDYVVFERFKKCVWRATGVTRLFSAVRIDAGDGFVRIQFGVEPKRGDKLIAGFVLNIPLSKDYRVDDDGSLAPSGGGQSTGVESRLAPELGEDASEEPSACDKDEEGISCVIL